MTRDGKDRENDDVRLLVDEEAGESLEAVTAPYALHRVAACLVEAWESVARLDDVLPRDTGILSDWLKSLELTCQLALEVIKMGWIRLGQGD